MASLIQIDNLTLQVDGQVLGQELANALLPTLGLIVDKLDQLLTQGATNMGLAQDIEAKVDALQAAYDQLPTAADVQAAVDTLEDLIKNSGMTQADKDLAAAKLAQLGGLADGLTAFGTAVKGAVTDAGDDSDRQPGGDPTP
jgi:hypothetical protein